MPAGPHLTLTFPENPVEVGLQTYGSGGCRGERMMPVHGWSWNMTRKVGPGVDWRRNGRGSTYPPH
jgi:hypothetical protein